MECARVLGLRGYDVHLREAESELGGHWKQVVKLPRLNEWGRVITYRQIQLSKQKNVEVPKTDGPARHFAHQGEASRYGGIGKLSLAELDPQFLRMRGQGTVADGRQARGMIRRHADDARQAPDMQPGPSKRGQGHQPRAHVVQPAPGRIGAFRVDDVRWQR